MKDTQKDQKQRSTQKQRKSTKQSNEQHNFISKKAGKIPSSLNMEAILPKVNKWSNRTESTNPSSQTSGFNPESEWWIQAITYNSVVGLRADELLMEEELCSPLFIVPLFKPFCNALQLDNSFDNVLLQPRVLFHQCARIQNGELALERVWKPLSERTRTYSFSAFCLSNILSFLSKTSSIILSSSICSLHRAIWASRSPRNYKKDGSVKILTSSPKVYATYSGSRSGSRSCHPLGTSSAEMIGSSPSWVHLCLLGRACGFGSLILPT